MLRKRLLSTAAMLVLLAGCGNHGGNEFLGKWVNVKSEKRTIEIVRNGDSFILRETAPSFIDGKMETKNIPATLKDGTLQVQTGFGVSTLAVDKSTGHLTNGQTEYTHAN
jgi:hypothetical protein